MLSFTRLFEIMVEATFRGILGSPMPKQGGSLCLQGSQKQWAVRAFLRPLEWMLLISDLFLHLEEIQSIFGFYQVSQKILIWSKTLPLLFVYFQQDSYKIQFLAGGLDTGLDWTVVDWTICSRQL